MAINDRDGAKKGLIPVLVVLGFVLLLVAASIIYHPDVGDDDGGGISRDITFPRDEGLHEELNEIWTFHIKFTTEGGESYYLASSYTYQVLDSSNVKANREILLLNTRSHTEYTDWSNQYGTLYGADSRCALVYNYNNTKTGLNFNDWWTRENGTMRYTYHFEIYNGTYMVVKGDLQMLDSIGKPILVTDNGFIHIPGEATISAYFQPRMKVSGQIEIKGQSLKLEDGMGDITHMWGGIPKVVGEQFILALPDEHTLIALHYDYASNGSAAFESLVEVKPDNTYEIIKAPSLRISPKKYVIAPYDVHQTVIWAHQWNIRTDTPQMNMTISGIYNLQFPHYFWNGLCYANGTFMGKYYETGAFAYITHHYISFIHITHHQLKQDPEVPTDDMTISCQVNHTFPIKKVVMWYNTSRDANWTSVELTNQTEYYLFNGEEHSDIWEGVVPGQPLFTTINYYIEVTDISGHSERTLTDSHYVEIEYPDR